MNPIRPSVLPTTPHSGQPQDAGKLAAQRAFFELTGQAKSVAAAAQTAVPTPKAELTAAPPPSEAPQRILRPGSLIDIRV